MSFTKNLYRSKLDSILTDMHCNIMKSKVYLVFEEYYYLRTKNQSSESSIRSYIIVLRNDKGSDVEEKKNEKVRWPGIEPGSTAWKATMLTFTPPTQRTKILRNDAYKQRTHHSWFAINHRKTVVSGCLQDMYDRLHLR